MTLRSVRPLAPTGEATPLESYLRGVNAANEAPRLQYALVRRIYVVSFLAPPTLAEVTELEADLIAAVAQLRPPVHYLGIIDASSDVPGANVRKALSDFGRTVNAKCESAHLVVQGEGFRSALQRSVITAIHLLKGQRVHCYRTLSEATPSLAKLVEMDPGELGAALRRAIAV